MGKKIFYFSLAILGILTTVWVFWYEVTWLEVKNTPAENPQLVDPEMAPEDQRDKVMHGFRILQQTQKYASQYAGDKITCNNCHFDGGNSLGGKNNGIPLVGVAQKYPLYFARAGRMMDLAERIDNCFERSLNGKALPHDSPEMESLIAYFNWISTPVADFKERPWLGMKPLRIKYLGAPERGKPLYDSYCASCHGKNGEGGKTEEGNDVPPLWGDQAFNDGAGMAKASMFASFIYWNMPYGQPFLTEKDALDIAAFVTTQPRTHLPQPAAPAEH